jgi:toxin ParE1/3/4
MAAQIFEVELSQGAEDDFETIYDYLAENRSVSDAEALLDEFVKRIDSLEQFPLRGAMPKELETLGIREFRQILLGQYRIIYRVIAKKVFILIIADGRRDMRALLERRLLNR